jgi:hypothetical protein
MSMKEWGKRHFSNDWTYRFKGKKSVVTGGSSEERSRSRDLAKPAEPLSSKPPPPAQKALHAEGCTPLLATQLFKLVAYFFSFFFLDENGNRKFTFPSRKPRKELEPLQLNSSTTGEYYPYSGTISTTSRSRATSLRSTPSGRRTYTIQNNVVTPTRSLLRLPLQGSNSQDGPSLNNTNTWNASNNHNMPKSAKKWGRTAHLHEVRSAVPHSSVFSSTGGSGQKAGKRGGNERPSGPRFDEYDSEDVFSSQVRRRATPSSIAVDDEDPWVDTDGVGSESGADLAH